ncbi:MAG: hypothetical protein JXL85_00635 [Bacilli bacterium]|nr:hypothetical protein [Bacilli bacterium]
MNVIANRDLISEILTEVIKPSILRIDESYYKDLDFIHCIVHFDNTEIHNLDELFRVDDSLLNNTSRVLINIISGINLQISEIEAITNIIYTETNCIDYFINLNFDVEECGNHIELLIFFVE